MQNVGQAKLFIINIRYLPVSQLFETIQMKEMMLDMGFNKEYATELSKKLNHIQQQFVCDLVSEMGYRDVRSFNKFIELNERGLIDNKDVTSYKTIEDVLGQISIAELKLIDKELEKLVLKLHEDEEWLIIKPLTYESSKKYGAGTRWCTAAESEDYQFYNYTSRGILIYTINKKTGYKVATFKNLDKEHTRELSFWDVEDNRLDSLELNLPDDIMDIIITDLRNCQQSNYHLAPDEIKAINDNAKGDKKISNSLRTLGKDRLGNIGMKKGDATGEDVSLRNNFKGGSPLALETQLKNKTLLESLSKKLSIKKEESSLLILSIPLYTKVDLDPDTLCVVFGGCPQ